ncbi:MAG: hypothetical protein FJ096_15030 [Deltaproteobacteria bacterium]|nr:hypothetical protein [Deltaproteobacteria bacterium]
MPLVPDARLRWLLRAAAFLNEGGAEPVAGLVLPNTSCFPDRFDGTPGAVQRLMARVLRHAGMSDVAVEVQLVLPDGEGAKSCKSGGSCSAPVLDQLTRRRVVRLDDVGYAVAVSTGEAGHATALTTGLVRAASSIFLSEAGLDEEIEPREREGYVDVAGALLGFGVLLANGAHITHKGCSGVTVQRVTALPVEELVVALTMSCALHELSPRAARAELDEEPRRGFDEAWAWVEANADTLALVKSNRLAIDADGYRLVEPGGFFARLFGGRSRGKPPTERELSAHARPVDAEKARRMAALRELVDDALD